MIVESHHKRIKEINTYISGLMSHALWRTHCLNDWQISNVFSNRASIGFVGLVNLGATCYINSVV